MKTLEQIIKQYSKDLEENRKDLPWYVRRAGIDLDLSGDQVCFHKSDSDYLSLEDSRKVVDYMAAQLGGSTKWNKK